MIMNHPLLGLLIFLVAATSPALAANKPNGLDFELSFEAGVEDEAKIKPSDLKIFSRGKGSTSRVAIDPLELVIARSMNDTNAFDEDDLRFPAPANASKKTELAGPLNTLNSDARSKPDDEKQDIGHSIQRIGSMLGSNKILNTPINARLSIEGSFNGKGMGENIGGLIENASKAFVQTPKAISDQLERTSKEIVDNFQSLGQKVEAKMREGGNNDELEKKEKEETTNKPNSANLLHESITSGVNSMENTLNEQLGLQVPTKMIVKDKEVDLLSELVKESNKNPGKRLNLAIRKTKKLFKLESKPMAKKAMARNQQVSSKRGSNTRLILELIEILSEVGLNSDKVTSEEQLRAQLTEFKNKLLEFKIVTV